MMGFCFFSFSSFASRFFDFSRSCSRIVDQDALGVRQSSATVPWSAMTSRWQDHTSWIACGVPMPAPRGSPAGPNPMHE
jgi:hypothetical protein